MTLKVLRNLSVVGNGVYVIGLDKRFVTLPKGLKYVHVSEIT